MAFDNKNPSVSCPQDAVGAIVRSLAGRDAKRVFMITALCEDSSDGAVYVYVADGNLRKVGKPKKKKIKHLTFLAASTKVWHERVVAGDITDSELRTILREFKQELTTQNS